MKMIIIVIFMLFSLNYNLQGSDSKKMDLEKVENKRDKEEDKDNKVLKGIWDNITIFLTEYNRLDRSRTYVVQNRITGETEVIRVYEF